MYQNAIYICISWYSKISWFPLIKYRCQQNSRGVPRDSYICATWFIAGYVWQILWVGGPFCPPSPHPWGAPKKPILNKVKLTILLAPAPTELHFSMVYLQWFIVKLGKNKTMPAIFFFSNSFWIIAVFIQNTLSKCSPPRILPLVKLL